MWTKEQIQTLLATRDEMVVRSIVVMFNRQTADEQQDEGTKHNNGIGFNGVDAPFGTSLAKAVLRWQSVPEGQRKYPNPLSDKQLNAARKMLKRYVGQLVEEANSKLS